MSGPVKINASVLWAFAAFGILLAVVPTQRLARSAKEVCPRLADAQDWISVKVGRPVAYADMQDYAHIVFFAVLGFLFMSVFNRSRKPGYWNVLALSLLLVAVLSVMLEGLQLLVPGRQVSLADVILNLKGWIAGVTVYTFIWLSRYEK